MRKISVSSSKGLLLNFIMRVILLSSITVIGLTAIFSLLAFKLDLKEDYFKYISLICISISSIIISYFSVKPFKNNGFIVGIISVIPVIIYSLVNLIVFKNDIVFFLIKVVAVLLLGGLFGYLSIKNTKKIRIK